MDGKNYQGFSFIKNWLREGVVDALDLILLNNYDNFNYLNRHFQNFKQILIVEAVCQEFQEFRHSL